MSSLSELIGIPFHYNGNRYSSCRQSLVSLHCDTMHTSTTTYFFWVFPKVSFQSNQSRDKKTIANKNSQRLASYKVTVRNMVFHAFGLAIAEKALPAREASVILEAFMHNHEMAYASTRYGPDSIEAKVRRYFFICKPSLTARRKLFRTLLSFVTEQNWSEHKAIDALIHDIQEQLHLSTNKIRSSARDRVTKSTSTRSGPTLNARPKKERPPPKWAKILNCAPNASLEVIKQAYRKKVSKLHPDRFQGKGLSEEEMRAHYGDFYELQEAYEIAVAAIKRIG